VADFRVLHDPGEHGPLRSVESLSRLHQQPGQLPGWEKSGRNIGRAAQCPIRGQRSPPVRGGFAGTVRRSLSQRCTCRDVPGKPSSRSSRHRAIPFSHPAARRAFKMAKVRIGKTGRRILQRAFRETLRLSIPAYGTPDQAHGPTGSPQRLTRIQAPPNFFIKSHVAGTVLCPRGSFSPTARVWARSSPW
jgi:hypothetical protein